MKKLRLVTAILLLGALTGCAVVNIYVTFPEEKIRKAANSIEDQIDKGASLLRERIFALIETEAYAQELSQNLNMDSPKIKEAANLRKSWVAELNGYKKSGYAGENNRFEVTLINAPTDPATTAKVSDLLKRENAQRRALLDEIAVINNMAPAQKAQLPEFFAESRRNNAAAGDWIQTPAGAWKQK